MRERERARVHPRHDPVSLTKQEFKDDCDVNVIVERFASTGIVQKTNKGTPVYADSSMSPLSLQEHYDQVEEVDRQFMSMSAGVRKAAGNNPVQFLRMLDDEEGSAVLVEAGLEVKTPVQAEPVAVPAAPPAAPEAPPEPPG